MTSRTKQASHDAADVSRRRAAAVAAARDLGDRTVTVTVEWPKDHRGPTAQFEMTGFAAAKLITDMAEPAPRPQRRPGLELEEALAQSERVSPRFTRIEELANVFESQGRDAK